MREKFLEILTVKWKIVSGFLFILIIFIYREQTFADMKILNIVKNYAINADFDEIDNKKGPEKQFFTEEDSEFLELHYNTESNRRAKVPLRFRKAGRVSCGGARETH